MTFLLDANVLIPFCFTDHIHHRSANAWIASHPQFAVCPITEGALVRFILRSWPSQKGYSERTLRALSQSPGYEFWADDISYMRADLARIAGHKQATDAYLVALAASRGSMLATLDGALSALHAQAQLVPYVP